MTKSICIAPARRMLNKQYSFFGIFLQEIFCCNRKTRFAYTKRRLPHLNLSVDALFSQRASIFRQHKIGPAVIKWNHKAQKGSGKCRERKGFRVLSEHLRDAAADSRSGQGECFALLHFIAAQEANRANYVKFYRTVHTFRYQTGIRKYLKLHNKNKRMCRRFERDKHNCADWICCHW